MDKENRVIIEGDHGLFIDISKEMYDKCAIKKEGNKHIIEIKTELWEEVTD